MKKRCLLIVALAIFMAGCAHRTHFVRGGRETVYLEKGVVAPYDGYLLTPEYLSEVYERLASTENVER